MRRRLIRWLLIVVQWLDPSVALIAVSRDALYTRAGELMQLEEHRKSVDPSGEQRRHQVYARLRKEFPAVSWRAISLAMEAALDGVR